ncbi:hypothetical protein [Streptococcus orisasini]|uniref:hypothetical protein n=1 Tax=Streptococcus orisasini TaxID=1080071 RepID=UPI00070EBC15|nr:hypothetical protein [Streptococcus orisasini]
MLNNNFNGGTNIGSGNSAGRDQIINNYISSSSQEKQPIAKYNVEPIWRSPITMAVLTWLGFFSSLGGIFSILKAFEPVLKWVNSSKQGEFSGINKVYMFIFLGILLITIIIFSLRTITSRQTRYPLVLNYAISGLGNRLTLEKIKVHNCPICNGEMKFFNKPIETKEIVYSDGKTKTEVTKRTPALQCRRNPEHWFKVDPAEDKI